MNKVDHRWTVENERTSCILPFIIFKFLQEAEADGEICSIPSVRLNFFMVRTVLALDASRPRTMASSASWAGSGTGHRGWKGLLFCR